MIKIKHAIPPQNLEALDADLAEGERTALILKDYSEGLLGFMYSDDDPDVAIAVYDRAMIVNALAKTIQDESGGSDDDAIERAMDQVSWDESFSVANGPVYVTLGGDYMGFNFSSYQANAERTAKGFNNPYMIANWGLGLAGETGEVIELIKKSQFHGKGLDIDELAKELGDVLWYVSAICTQVGLSLEDVAERNIDKLMNRYPNGFVLGGGNRDD